MISSSASLSLPHFLSPPVFFFHSLPLISSHSGFFLDVFSSLFFSLPRFRPHFPFMCFCRMLQALLFLPLCLCSLSQYQSRAYTAEYIGTCLKYRNNSDLRVRLLSKFIPSCAVLKRHNTTYALCTGSVWILFSL